MKHIKILGLLAVAAMAITAIVGTTAASAEVPGALTTDKPGNALVTSKVSEHTFTVTGSNVNCNKISFSGTAGAATARTQTATPKYEECTAFGFANATVNTTGCSYTFSGTTTGEAGNTEKTHAPVTLSGCTAGGVIITVSVPFIAKCKVLVPNQVIADAVHYTNKTDEVTKRTDVIVKATAKTIEDKVEESSGACPLTVGTHKNAEYTGSQTVQVEGGNLSYDKDHTP